MVILAYIKCVMAGSLADRYQHCGGICGFHLQIFIYILKKKKRKKKERKNNSLRANKQNYEVFFLGQGSQTLSDRPSKAVNVCPYCIVETSLMQTVHVNPTPVPILRSGSADGETERH
jgi:hypothetical protein